MFLKFIEFFVVLALVGVALVEVVWPALRGHQLFPSFKKQGKLEDELAAVRQQREEDRIRNQIKKERTRVKSS
jgi:hypothetical protein